MREKEREKKTEKENKESTGEMWDDGEPSSLCVTGILEKEQEGKYLKK